MIDYMQIAIKEAKKSLKFDDVPVGCVIVQKNKIVAKAYNKKEKNKCITRHAEVIAIEKACKKLGTWHLDDCTIYTTLEPCLMCTTIISQSRIKNVIYALKNDFHEDLFDFIGRVEPLAKKVNKNKGSFEKESLEMIQKFFQKKRK